VLTTRGELYVFKEGQGGPNRTFHPKVFVFESNSAALAIVGSGNLTQRGLFLNHEAALAVSLDLAVAEDAALLADILAFGLSHDRPGIAGNRSSGRREFDPRAGLVTVKRAARRAVVAMN